MKSGGAFYQTTRMSLSYLKFAVESEGKGGKHMERFETRYLLGGCGFYQTIRTPFSHLKFAVKSDGNESQSL
jgi:hypothetical protein